MTNRAALAWCAVTILAALAVILSLPLTGCSGPSKLHILTESLPDITCKEAPDGTRTGSPYRVQLQATGGTLPYQWQFQKGQLPPGLTISADGLISGIPDCNAIAQQGTTFAKVNWKFGQ